MAIPILFAVGFLLWFTARPAKAMTSMTDKPKVPIRSFYNVESWRALATEMGPIAGIPVAFLLAWIKHESAGNPCSFTKAKEAGIFQLLPPDNIRDAGTTFEAMRASCVGDTQSCNRKLTDAEMREHMRAGIQYIQKCMAKIRSRLASVGATWDESGPDFWRMVKLVHALPGFTNSGLKAVAQKLGRAPTTWREFRDILLLPSVQENVAARDKGTARYLPLYSAKPKPIGVSEAGIADRILNNAERTGGAVGGFPNA